MTAGAGGILMLAAVQAAAQAAWIRGGYLRATSGRCRERGDEHLGVPGSDGRRLARGVWLVI